MQAVSCSSSIALHTTYCMRLVRTAAPFPHHYEVTFDSAITYVLPCFYCRFEVYLTTTHEIRRVRGFMWVTHQRSVLTAPIQVSPTIINNKTTWYPTRPYRWLKTILKDLMLYYAGSVPSDLFYQHWNIAGIWVRGHKATVNGTEHKYVVFYRITQFDLFLDRGQIYHEKSTSAQTHTQLPIPYQLVRN